MIAVHVVVIIVLVACTNIGEGRSCLNQYSKAKFDAQRRNLKSLLTEVKTRVGNIDKEMSAILTDFKKSEWKRYNDHCYYFGSKALNWFMAEHKCKQMGSYLAVVDDSSENIWIAKNMPQSTYYWNGLTDLMEQKWRWSYDQSIAKYKPWYSGYGARGTSYNCVVMQKSYYWLDLSCQYQYKYVCESNMCY